MGYCPRSQNIFPPSSLPSLYTSQGFVFRDLQELEGLELNIKQEIPPKVNTRSHNKGNQSQQQRGTSKKMAKNRRPAPASVASLRRDGNIRAPFYLFCIMWRGRRQVRSELERPSPYISCQPPLFITLKGWWDDCCCCFWSSSIFVFDRFDMVTSLCTRRLSSFACSSCRSIHSMHKIH